MNTTRARSLLLRKVLRLNRALKDYSQRTWTLHPAETRTAPAAVFFSNELDRVTGWSPDSSLQQELQIISGGPANHGSTVAHEIRDVELLDGTLIKGAASQPLTRRKARLFAPAIPEVAEPMALASTLYGSRFFGHWMTDDLTLHLAAESIARPVSVARPPYHHEAGYCELLGIGRTHIGTARFRKLIVLDDTAQNRHKVARYQELRTRLRARLPQDPHRGSGDKRIYIRRGTSGARSSPRQLLNTPDVEHFLVSQGFTIVDLDQLSAREIALAICDATLVVGMEGSHLLHAIYAMADGATLCILQAPFHFSNVIKYYADCLELRYGFTIGIPQQDGFIIKLDDLKRVLDRLDSA